MLSPISDLAHESNQYRFLAGKAGMLEKGGTPAEKGESAFDLVRDGIISYCYVGTRPPRSVAHKPAHLFVIACKHNCKNAYLFVAYPYMQYLRQIIFLLSHCRGPP